MQLPVPLRLNCSCCLWRLELESVCHENADVIIVLDQSTSVVADGYENWFTRMLGFACDITRLHDVGPNDTQIGLLKFSDEIEIGFHLNEHADKTSVIGAILQQDILGGDTNIAEALKQTRDMFSPSHGARAGTSKLVFLVTDGMNCLWLLFYSKEGN